MGLSDRELLRAIQSDAGSFSILYDRYYQPVFGYVFRRTGDYDLSRDITAETFLRAFQKIGFFEWRGISLGSWLYKIAGNEVNQYFRKSKYRPACLEDLAITNHFAYEAGIETEKAAMEKELLENLAFSSILNKLQELDTRYQEVIALRFFESKTIHEIMDILGKKEGTVKSLLSRGIRQLKEKVEGDEAFPEDVFPDSELNIKSGKREG